jgi:hypothetical protein
MLAGCASRHASVRQYHQIPNWRYSRPAGGSAFGLTFCTGEFGRPGMPVRAGCWIVRSFSLSAPGYGFRPHRWFLSCDIRPALRRLRRGDERPKSCRGGEVRGISVCFWPSASRADSKDSVKQRFRQPSRRNFQNGRADAWSTAVPASPGFTLAPCVSSLT